MLARHLATQSTQPLTEQNTDNQTLIESFPGTKLCKLTIFENFNESYPGRYFRCPAIRVPNPAVSRKLAYASLHLKTLSASFIADAGHFFAACQDSWTWDKLTSLALTLRILTNDADTSRINNMLQDAALAALKMPRLDTMELWNGRRGGNALSLPEGSRWTVGHHHDTGDIGAYYKDCDQASLGCGRSPALPGQGRRANILDRSRCDSMPRRCDPPAGTHDRGR